MNNKIYLKGNDIINFCNIIVANIKIENYSYESNLKKSINNDTKSEIKIKFKIKLDN